MAGAFDQYNNAIGTSNEITIAPTAEICPDRTCQFWNGTNCANAECRYIVPEVINSHIGRSCIICGAIMTVTPANINTICPKCISDIQRAIRLAHSPGGD